MVSFLDFFIPFESVCSLSRLLRLNLLKPIQEVLFQYFLMFSSLNTKNCPSLTHSQKTKNNSSRQKQLNSKKIKK